MTVKQILLPVLCLYALLLASCSDSGTVPAVTDAANMSDTAAAVTEPAQTDKYESIRARINEGADFGGTPFHIISYQADNWNIYLEPAAENGETLNDAAFRRNTEVEDLLNIDITAIYHDDYVGQFRRAVLAGDSTAYDLICFWSPGDYSGLITDQIVYDWTQLPNIDLTADWYNKTANTAYSINGRQFFAVSDFTYPVHQHFRILYNKDLFRTLQYDSTPYDDVFAGTWTFDRMKEYTRGLYSDLDGDGKKSLGDRYGIVLNNAFCSMFPLSAGELPVSCGEGGFTFNLFSERIVSIVEDIVAFDTDPDAYLNKQTNNEQYTIFESGNAIFEPYASDPLSLRDLEFDFGYLPYPKYDDSQQDYVVIAAGGLTAIPNSVADPDRTGLIMEALVIASHAYVADAFIEQYIENKILRDEESQKIYRMMRSLQTYDLSYNIDPSGKLANYAYYSYFMKKQDANVASYYEKSITAIEKKYSAMYELIVEQ